MGERRPLSPMRESAWVSTQIMIRTNLALGCRFPALLENGRLSLSDDFLHPFRQGLAVPRGRNSEKFRSEILATVAAVVTGSQKSFTCVNVFRLERFLQGEGRREVNFRNSRCSLVIQPKRDELGRRQSRERKRVIREERESHGSREDG